MVEWRRKSTGSALQKHVGGFKYLSVLNEEDYAAFLKKRLESSNYKNGVSKEEYEKTKAKYEKVKLKLKLFI